MANVTLNKQETALLLAAGDFWTAVSADKTSANLDSQLYDLYDIYDAHAGTNELHGTFPDDTVAFIGTSPRRPHRPTA